MNVVTLDMVIAADTYNEGVRYLGREYGYRDMGYTCSFQRKLGSAKNLKERRAIEASATEGDRVLSLQPNQTIHDFRNSNDYEVYLLLNQYQYGIEAKKDLYNKLIYLGVLEYPKP